VGKKNLHWIWCSNQSGRIGLEKKKNQSERIGFEEYSVGFEEKSVGKNWVGGKISGEELGSRKNQWGRIGFEEKSVKNNWVRGKITQEQLGSRKDHSRTIGFEKKISREQLEFVFLLQA
jgi:hypothetical protein